MILRRKDIDARYTEIVRDYLMKGWRIVTKTQNGTQGEDAHIDLTDGDVLVRIYIEGCSFHDDDWWFASGLKIVVGVAGRLSDFENRWNTIWLEKLDVLSCDEYVLIDERRGVYCLKADYAEIHAKKRARMKVSYAYHGYEDFKRQDEARRIALRMIRKMNRKASAKLCDVGRVCYRIHDNGVRHFHAQYKGNMIQLA